MRKKLSLLIVLLFLLSLIVGCSSPAPSTTTDKPTADTPVTTDKSATGTDDVRKGKDGKTEMIVGFNLGVNYLDPHNCVEATSGMAIAQIYNRLLTANDKMELQPGLAKEWSMLSDKEWKFVLRDDVYWHDGTKFTANDVKFSVERQQSLPAAKSRVAGITNIEVVDDYTVIFTTEEPNAVLGINFTTWSTSIVSEKAVTEAGADYGLHPIGTGPMKFDTWKLGEELVMAKNEKYFEDISVSPDRLIFKSIPESTSRTIALETGEVDMIVNVEPTDKEKIQNNSKLKLIEIPSSKMEYMGINTKKAPFDNKLVREAIAHAIDKDTVNIIATDGRATIAKSVISESIFGYNPNVKEYKYDIEEAKRLLTEAGYPNGFNAQITVFGESYNRVAQAIQSNLAEVGITLDIDLLEQSVYLEKLGSGEQDLYLHSWTPVNYDADLAMYSHFHSSRMGIGGNRSFYSNPKVDELLTKGQQEMDVEKRKQVYGELQEILMEDCVWVPLYSPTFDRAVQVDLQGVDMQPAALRYFDLHY